MKGTPQASVSNEMGTARVPGLLLKTGVPLMISMLINSLYNFVDSVFVSRIAEDALTALSLAAPVQILMSAMGLGIAVGLNAVISKALGEQDGERVEKTASAALVLAFLAWVLVAILEIAALEPYFRWQSGGDASIVGYGVPYLRICMLYAFAFYLAFFLVMELVPEQVLRLFDASEKMLAIGATALRIMAVSYLLSNVCLIYSAAFQGLQSMVLTLSRQVVLPVAFIAVFSRFGELSLIWTAFVLAEAVVIPFGMLLWRREAGRVLKMERPLWRQKKYPGKSHFSQVGQRASALRNKKFSHYFPIISPIS